MKTKIIALSALAMLCGAAAWAGKPEQFPFGPFPVTGEEVTDCGDFHVLMDYTFAGVNRFYFNPDGSLNRLLITAVVPESIYYNSNEPSYRRLPGTAEHLQQWYHFDEDETLIDMVATGAPSRVILPGYGPVFMGVGRVKFDFVTGEIEFMAGQFDQFTGNNDAICAALRP